MVDAIATIVGFIGGMALAILSILYKSAILVSFWGWFITPYFPNIPDINIWLGFGLILIGNILTCQISAKESSNVFVYLFVSPSFILFFGWLAHLILSR